MPYIQDYIRASPVVEPLEMFTKSVLVTQAQWGATYLGQENCF